MRDLASAELCSGGLVAVPNGDRALLLPAPRRKVTSGKRRIKGARYRMTVSGRASANVSPSTRTA